MQARLLRNSVAYRVEAGPSYQLALPPPLELLMFHAVQTRKGEGKNAFTPPGQRQGQAARARDGDPFSRPRSHGGEALGAKATLSVRLTCMMILTSLGSSGDRSG